MDATKANEILQQLTESDVLQAYSGRPGCACGCNGKYVITKEGRAEADVSRGYPHDDEDVNPRQVRRVLKQVQMHECLKTPYDTEGKSPYVDIDQSRGHDTFWWASEDLQYITYQAHPGRVYTVYLTSAARRKHGVTEGYDLR